MLNVHDRINVTDSGKCEIYNDIDKETVSVLIVRANSQLTL